MSYPGRGTEKKTETFDEETAGVDDDFDTASSKEAKEYRVLEAKEVEAKVVWKVDEGINAARMLNLYPLLANSSSMFCLRSLAADMPFSTRLKEEEAFFFRNIRGDKIVLFRPDDYRYRVIFDPRSHNVSVNYLNSEFLSTLSRIKLYVADSLCDIRFVIPIVERGNNLRDIAHSVLFCIDYDSSKNTFYSAVFDSISRRGMMAYCASLATWIVRADSDKELAYMLQQTLGSSVELTRYDYGHQNRMLEGSCGSYTFACIHIVANCFDQVNNFQYLVNSHIKSPNGFIIADNFLKAQARLEIEARVNEHVFEELDLNSLRSLLSVDMEEQLVKVDDDYAQTIDSINDTYFSSGPKSSS